MKYKIIGKEFTNKKVTFFMKKFLFILLLPFLFIFSLMPFPGSVEAKEIPRIILQGNGDLPFSASVTTTGIGRMPVSDSISYEQKKSMARRAAMLDGYRNLLAAIQGGKKYFTELGTEVIHIEGYLKDIVILETRYLVDGTVEVDMTVILKVYDPAVLDDKKMMKILQGGLSTDLEGIEVVEVDETHETIQNPDIIFQGNSSGDE